MELLRHFLHLWLNCKPSHLGLLWTVSHRVEGYDDSSSAYGAHKDTKSPQNFSDSDANCHYDTDCGI